MSAIGEPAAWLVSGANDEGPERGLLHGRVAVNVLHVVSFERLGWCAPAGETCRRFGLQTLGALLDDARKHKARAGRALLVSGQVQPSMD